MWQGTNNGKALHWFAKALIFLYNIFNMCLLSRLYICRQTNPVIPVQKQMFDTGNLSQINDGFVAE